MHYNIIFCLFFRHKLEGDTGGRKRKAEELRVASRRVDAFGDLIGDLA